MMSATTESKNNAGENNTDKSNTDINSASLTQQFDLASYRITRWQKLLFQIEKPHEKAFFNDAHCVVAQLITEIKQYEVYWAFPGIPVIEKIEKNLKERYFQQAKQLISNVITQLENPRIKAFSPYSTTLDKLEQPLFKNADDKLAKPCFEFLIFHPNPAEYHELYHRVLASLATERDEFYYDIVFVDNLADAFCALIANENIQACLSVSNLNVSSENSIANNLLTICPELESLAQQCAANGKSLEDTVFAFLTVAKKLRPELEHYYLAEVAFAELPPQYFEKFNRVFYHQDPFNNLHLHLLNGIRERYNTPFFNALQAYSKKPRGLFHALPISRASSIKDSVWLADFYQFYGDNVFLAETSSTQGGMDSYLNPKGVIKQSQNKAASAFGAQHSYFVTNGTSSANKIVIQANVQPGDIIFVSSDCHKSVPYGVMLAGAHAMFLQTNAVDEQDLYGAVSLTLIKEKLLALKSINLLDKVKAIVLTNSTFDGLIYNVEAYMEAILTIKPDMVFLWDEAWFAHAHFNCLYQNRHAMSVAAKLKQRYKSQHYYKKYQALTTQEKTQYPDPDKVAIRVYATQSTHKTLSCFRQGSMIHIFDDAFNQDIFLEALYTHSSTSPNYQILGSLDIARRQMNIEGFALTQKSIRLGQYIRNEMKTDTNIANVFSVLSAQDIYPEQNGSSAGLKNELAYISMLREFNGSNFVVDPTRLTVDIRKTGMQGNAFRQLLIDRYDIQVNKTSEFTVLFIVNIGATMETAQYLLNVLREIAEHIIAAKAQVSINSPAKHLSNKARPDMPKSRLYHPLFSSPYSTESPCIEVVDMRKAYYSAYLHENISHILLNSAVICAAEEGETWVSAAFVTPYPPGFPMLVPGQIINITILRYFSSISTNEIHGYHSKLGLKVFNQKYLSTSSKDMLAKG